MNQNKIMNTNLGSSGSNLVFVFKESWDLVFCILIGTYKAVRSLYDNKFYQVSLLDYKTHSSFDIPAM